MNIYPEYSDERPEPFCTIMDLIRQHGLSEILDSAAKFTEFESESEDICKDCAAEYRDLSTALFDLAKRAEAEEC